MGDKCKDNLSKSKDIFFRDTSMTIEKKMQAFLFLENIKEV